MQRTPAVLLFQGLAAAPQELQALAQTLRRAGLEVVLPRPPVRDAPVLPFEQWLDRARDQFDALARQHGEVVVGGLGTGALQAQALGLQRRPAALLLLSPGLPALSTVWQQRLPVSALFQAWRLQRYLRPHLQDVQAPTLRLQTAGPSASRALDFLLEWAAPPPLAAAA